MHSSAFAEQIGWSAKAHYFSASGDNSRYQRGVEPDKYFPEEFRQHNGAIDGGQLELAWSMRYFSRPSFSLSVRSGLAYSYQEAGYEVRKRIGTLVYFLAPDPIFGRHTGVGFRPFYNNVRVTTQENAVSAFGEFEARLGPEAFGFFAKTGIKAGAVSRTTLAETFYNYEYLGTPLRERRTEVLGALTGYWSAGLRFSPEKRLEITAGIYGEWFDLNAEFRPTLGFSAGLALAF